MFRLLQSDFRLCQEGDRVGIHLLFDVPRVSKDTKHVPLTDEQIATMILMRMNNATVYDKAGRWVSIPETSYGERLIIFENNSNIINNLVKRMRCSLVFRSLSRCTRSKLLRICGGPWTKPFNGLTRTAHRKFSVRSRHTSAGGAGMHHSCSSQRTRARELTNSVTCRVCRNSSTRLTTCFSTRTEECAAYFATCAQKESESVARPS